DRDRGKRPVMGRIAAGLADRVWLTSDNPRSEDPAAIIEEIAVGVAPLSPGGYARDPDRREAIRQALAWARGGDTVVIAGKGHETYQIIAGQVLPFDDRLVAKEFLSGCVRRGSRGWACRPWRSPSWSAARTERSSAAGWRRSSPACPSTAGHAAPVTRSSRSAACTRTATPSSSTRGCAAPPAR